MNITDIPNSGIYFQQGVIVQLVVQLIDINTGEPVQLQTATNLTIAILYPDLETAASFNASLYTDGSDGRIVYTTVNDGITIDLDQVGLYQMQGNAVMGSVPLPPSYLTDFYVLRNVLGISAPPIINQPSGVILFDSGDVRWSGIVSPSGVLSWATTPSGPAAFFQPNQLVMQDPSGIYWTFAISSLGIVTSTAGGSYAHAIPNFILVDATGKSWIITVDESGNLVAS